MKILPRIFSHGNRVKAEKLIFFAKKQFLILENSMSFQKLKQNTRRLNFANGTQIKCTINHSIGRIDIFYPEKEAVAEAVNIVEEQAMPLDASLVGNRWFSQNIDYENLFAFFEDASEFPEDLQSTQMIFFEDPHVYGWQDPDAEDPIIARQVVNISNSKKAVLTINNHRCNTSSIDYLWDDTANMPYDGINYYNIVNTLYSTGRYVYLFGFEGPWAAFNGIQEIIRINANQYRIDIDTSSFPIYKYPEDVGGHVLIYGLNITWERYGPRQVNTMEHRAFGFKLSNDIRYYEDYLKKQIGVFTDYYKRDYIGSPGVPYTVEGETLYTSYDFDNESLESEQNAEVYYTKKPDGTLLKFPYRVYHKNRFESETSIIIQYNKSVLDGSISTPISKNITINVLASEENIIIYDWNNQSVFSRTETPIGNSSFEYVWNDSTMKFELISSNQASGGSSYDYDPYYLYNHDGYIGIYGLVNDGQENYSYLFIPLEKTNDTQEGNVNGLYFDQGIFEYVDYPS